jgi:hypothetical protein
MMGGPPNKGRGKCVTFLREAFARDDADCIIWPFSTNGLGYGVFGYLGKNLYAHRFSCELKRGPAPTDGHQAAHSCGNGHNGCINPNHLSWKTNSENQLDRRVHGTQRVRDGIRQKLTREQVAQVRALKGKLSLFEIAEKFGVKRGCIEYWLRTDHEPMKPGTSSAAMYRRRQKLAAMSAPEREK